MMMASNYVNKVWAMAGNLGYNNYFFYEKANPITDDHYYINSVANIPAIDIVDLDDTENQYGGRSSSRSNTSSTNSRLRNKSKNVVVRICFGSS